MSSAPFLSLKDELSLCRRDGSMKEFLLVLTDEGDEITSDTEVLSPCPHFLRVTPWTSESDQKSDDDFSGSTQRMNSLELPVSTVTLSVYELVKKYEVIHLTSTCLLW